MADWKRVLLETDIASTVTNGNTATVPSEDAVYDFVTGITDNLSGADGTVTSVTAGDGLTQTGTASINPTLNVVGGDGITANADEVEVSVDDTTIELSASDGTGVVQAKTAAISDGGTALATADQIHAFVTGITNNLTDNDGTVTSVTAGDGMTQTGTDSVNPTLNVVGGDGITANADEIEVAVDDTTIELSASTGSGVVQAKTAAVSNGGTALATGDQIYDFVTGITDNLSNNDGTVTSVSVDGGRNITDDGVTITTDGTITLDLDQTLIDMVAVKGVNAATVGEVNLGGGDLTFTTGLSTGTGVGGDIFFKANDPGTVSGMTQNTSLVDVMKLAAPLTNGADPVVTIYGDLVVNGSTSSVDVQTLTVEDKTILVADGAASAANATSSGLIVDTTSTAANRANFLWKDSSAGVAGWEFKDNGAAASYPSMGVAALTKGAADPTSTIMPTGALFYNDGSAGTKGLYLYID